MNQVATIPSTKNFVIPEEELADVARTVHDLSAGTVTPRPAGDD